MKAPTIKTSYLLNGKKVCDITYSYHEGRGKATSDIKEYVNGNTIKGKGTMAEAEWAIIQINDKYVNAGCTVQGYQW